MNTTAPPNSTVAKAHVRASLAVIEQEYTVVIQNLDLAGASRVEIAEVVKARNAASVLRRVHEVDDG